MNVPVWQIVMINMDSQRTGNNFQRNGSLNAIYKRINKKGRIKTDGRKDKSERDAVGIDIKKRSEKILCSFDSRKTPA